MTEINLLFSAINHSNIDGLDSIDTTSPYVAGDLQILKRQIWNEALTYLGIENSNTEKKERLVTDEINSNLGGVEAQRYTRLNSTDRPQKNK